MGDLVMWAGSWPGQVRLPGYGGAAVLLRSVIQASEDDATPVLALDIGLLSPHSFTQYSGRAVAPGLSLRLSAFFLAAASHTQPESSIDPLVDDQLGLRIGAISSDEQRVGLLVTVVKDLDEPGGEPDGLDFETSRAVLAQAATDVRFLDHVDEDPGGVSEPPAEWSTR